MNASAAATSFYVFRENPIPEFPSHILYQRKTGGKQNGKTFFKIT